MLNYRKLFGIYCLSGCTFGSLIGYKNYKTSVHIEKQYGTLWPKKLTKQRFSQSFWKGVRWGVFLPFSVPLSFYDINKAYVLKSDLRTIRDIEYHRFHRLSMYYQ